MAEQVNPAGPVDIAVLGFLEGMPDGGVARVVSEAVASGAVRVLDAVIVERSESGDLAILDVDADAENPEVLGVPVDNPGLLGEEDIMAIAEEIPPGSIAALIVWENIWAVRVAAALDEVGGLVLAHERIDRADLDVVLDALSAS